MNAYFDNTSYTRAAAGKRQKTSICFGDRFISFICAIIGMVTCPAAVKIEKAIISVAIFVSFFGVIGGIEEGTLSWFAGIVICAVLSLLEYATLKSICNKKA